VETLIRQEWSPAEIRERLAREGQRPISHEWIYQYLKRDGCVCQVVQIPSGHEGGFH
jgi:IS30 family transposase